MGKIAVVTDSNSGITKQVAKEWGVYVLPMPFYIDGKLYLEDLTLTQPEFYEHLKNKAEISTSMPQDLGDTETCGKRREDARGRGMERAGDQKISGGYTV